MNNHAIFVQKDIQEVSGDELVKLYPRGSLKILIGCAPCTPFSRYSNSKPKNEKWKLLYSFKRLVEEVNPDIVSMENVPQLRKHLVFRHFKNKLEDLGYFVTCLIVSCQQYGVPQTRKRLVLIASKHGIVNFIKETHRNPKTVRDIIAKLPPIAAGEVCKKDRMHWSRNLSTINMKRITQIQEGESWKNMTEDLIAACHQKHTGKTYGGVYARMKWDEPGPTITTQFFGFGNGRFGHPSQNRAISLREAALLQTFLRYYKFLPPTEKLTGERIGRHIGNAVPVRLGRIIARSIKEHIKGIKKSGRPHRQSC